MRGSAQQSISKPFVVRSWIITVGPMCLPMTSPHTESTQRWEVHGNRLGRRLTPWYLEWVLNRCCYWLDCLMCRSAQLALKKTHPQSTVLTVAIGINWFHKARNVLLYTYWLLSSPEPQAQTSKRGGGGGGATSLTKFHSNHMPIRYINAETLNKVRWIVAYIRLKTREIANLAPTEGFLYPIPDTAMPMSP